MYLIDYHNHTLISPDSDTPLIENAKAAMAAGIAELCVTDHFDLLDFQGRRRYAHELDWASRLTQWEEVRTTVGDGLRLRLGIELGSGQVDSTETAKLLDRSGLDFVIGSLHNQSLAAGAGDLYYINYSSPALCYQVLDDYFSCMKALVEADCYDVLGHIIYPLRYMCLRDGQNVDLSRYMEVIRTLLRRAVERGRGMELNTWAGRTIEPWRSVLQAYRDCGGELITVGSDAHVASSIGSGIREAYELLRSEGFRYVTTYEKRRPIQIKL